MNLENKVVLSSSLSIILEKRLEEIFETITSNTDRSMLLQLFKDEDILRTIDSELNKFIPNKFTPGISFKIDRKYVIMTRDILGEYEPITLKNTINLARDYSVLGDSKTALEVEENLLPKIKRTFGDKSVEMVELLEMMATDYKILGNYGKSEESLLKAIEINKALYGDESSPKLLANLVNLINLRKVILKTDDPLYIALEKAAKNTSENDLSKSGYFRIKIVSDASKRYLTKVPLLNENFSQEYESITDDRAGYITKKVIVEHELSQLTRLGKMYELNLTWDVRMILNCKDYLGKYHHITLRTLCDLSEDYLVLKKFDDALQFDWSL